MAVVAGSVVIGSVDFAGSVGSAGFAVGCRIERSSGCSTERIGHCTAVRFGSSGSMAAGIVGLG